jgi:hypothetical protein
MYPCVGFSDVAMCRIMRLCIIEFVALCDTFELHLYEFENTLVDWDTLQIDDKVDDEDRFEVPSEEQVYSVLGLQKEDDSEQQGGNVVVVLIGFRMIVMINLLPFQYCSLPEERKMFDRNNHMMEPSSLYLNMKQFRLAMRQYAIDKEFELGIEATNTTRYRGYCRGVDCPWSINARVEHKGWDPVVVLVLHDDHECISLVGEGLAHQ